VGIGSITKQLAQQALGEQVDKLIETVSPSEQTSAKPEETASQVIIGQIQAMQKALKDDQELMVICNTGMEPLRIVEIYLPSWKVAVLTGIDAEKTVSRFISPVESLQLLCKPVPATGPKPLRLRIVAPKPAA
jgi:hypothetical protein